MPLLRFLQFSDLHLDCSLASSKLGLAPEKRRQIQRDIQQALTRIAELARSERVDVVLCPGDLWDGESVSMESATFFYETLGSISPIPVLIAPGNHDPYNVFSYHNPQYFKGKTGKTHPRNVHVFPTPYVERWMQPGLPGVDFYGCCFEQNVPRTDRILGRLRPMRDDVLNVLLLHGSQDDTLGTGSGQPIAAPFSSGELLASGFDYAALGHYHRFSQIAGPDGLIRGAYGGVPEPRSLSESGEHFALIGEIDKGGVRPDSLRKSIVGRRNVLRLRAEIGAGVTNAMAAKQRVEAVLRSSGARPEDIVYLELSGRTHPEILRFDFDPEWTAQQCFHLVIDQSALEPEYDLDALLADESAHKRVEGQFAARMNQLLQQASDNPARQRVLRAALCYGLDALRGREVKPRRVY